jgi:hypothetical protein
VLGDVVNFGLIARDGHGFCPMCDPGNTAASQAVPLRFVAAHKFFGECFIRPLRLLE